MSEVAASEFPALSAAIAGQFGFMRTIDYRGQDVLVAYRPVGSGFPGWGLIAKIDSAEAYGPVDRLRGCCWRWAERPWRWGWGPRTRSPGGSRGRSAGWPGRRRPSPPAI